MPPSLPLSCFTILPPSPHFTLRRFRHYVDTQRTNKSKYTVLTWLYRYCWSFIPQRVLTYLFSKAVTQLRSKPLAVPCSCQYVQLVCIAVETIRFISFIAVSDVRQTGPVTYCTLFVATTMNSVCWNVNAFSLGENCRRSEENCCLKSQAI